MTEHKFTDEEVIKALECCANADCLNCPRWSEDWSSGMCADFLPSVLAIINHQKAEIERLQVELDDLKRDTVPKLQLSLQRANAMGRELEVELEAMRCAANSYFEKVLAKKDTASHYAPGAEVVTVEVLEHYARQFTEGSGESG